MTPSGGGSRHITAGAYNWQNIQWTGGGAITLNVDEGVTLTQCVFNSHNISFSIETGATVIASGSVLFDFMLSDCEIISQGGPSVPFQPNSSAGIHIDLQNARFRIAAGSPPLFSFQQNVVTDIGATHAGFLTAGANAVFAAGSGCRILIRHDSSTVIGSPISTGVGTLITNVATAMNSDAGREFYSDSALKPTGPSLIAFGTAPSVQAAIDRLKQVLAPNLAQLQGTGSPTFGPTGILVQYGTAIARVGKLRHTNVGTLAGALFLDQTGYYRVGYSMSATGAPTSLAWEAYLRLAALGSPLGGTPIAQSVAIGLGNGSIGKSFLVLVPSAISLSAFVQIVDPTTGTLITQLSATGTDLAVEFVNSINTLGQFG